MNKLIVRQRETGTTIDFYASVFNQKSKPIHENGKEFVEVILPGAFDGADISNVTATLFHDKNKILGKTKSGTLKLLSDDTGFLASVNMGNTTLHKDTLESISRGDLDESSFIARIDDYKEVYEDGMLVRYISKFSLVRDVSIVGEGAYANTDIIIREMPENKENKDEVQKPEVVREVSQEDYDKVVAENEALKAKVDEKPADEEVKEDSEKEDEIEPKRAEDEKPADEEKPVEDNPEKVEDEKPAEDAKVEDKEEEKEIERSLVVNNEKNKQEMNFAEEIKRCVANGQGATIEVARAAGDGASTSFTNITPKNINSLSVIGKEPIWSLLGMDYLPNCQGTFVLPYESPIVGQQLAELTAVTKQTETDTGTLVTPKRFAVQKIYTAETLKSVSLENLAIQMANLEAGCDRAITTYAFTKALSGSTADATVTAITEANINKLSAAVDSDEPISLLMSRANFYASKGTKIDSGSGINLFTTDGQFGRDWEGKQVFYSALFTDTTHFMAATMSNLAMCDYGMSEIVVDPYTLASKGQVVITITKLAEITVKNPSGFKKSNTLA